MYFEILSRYNDIRVNIVSFVFYDVSFQFKALGSVILPVTADAAATSGEERYVCESTCPILPGKFLFVVLIQISSFAKTPICAPQQAPQVGGPTIAPASRNILMNPLSNAFL